jgi:hypothetical protein
MDKKKLMKDLEKQSKRSDEIFKTWEKGGHTFNPAEERLMALKEGEKIGGIVKDCTICPVGNGSCEHFMTWAIYGFNPIKGGKIVELMVCSIGIEGDGEKCPLNK